jgi:Tfp pilus assembly protein PilO
MRIPTWTLFVLAISLTLGAGVWFLVLPELHQLRIAQAQLQEWNAGGVAAAPSTTAMTLVAEHTAEHQEMTMLVPLTAQQYDLAVQVEGLNQSVGTTLSSLSITDSGVSSAVPAAATSTAVKTPSTLKPVAISLGIAGSYAQVEQFVSELPTLDRYIQISQISLTGGSVTTSAAPDQAKPGSSTISATLVAAAYYLPSATSAAN